MDSTGLHKNWEHSYDESEGDQLVFRPHGYGLPPLRGGRSALDLRSDKTFTQRGDLVNRAANLASDDRYHYSEGSWNLDGDNTLSLVTAPGSEPVKLKVVSVSDDKLVLQK